MDTKKKIVLVTTISSFKHTYAFWEDDGKDSSLVLDFIGDEDVEEVSQKWIGEQILDHRDVTLEEYLQIFDKENDYIKDWTVDKKTKYIINTEELDKKLEEKIKRQISTDITL